MKLTRNLLIKVINPSRKRRFSKLNVFRFGVNGKHFENGAFYKQWRHNNHVISFPRFLFFFSNENTKWPMIVVFSNLPV